MALLVAVIPTLIALFGTLFAMRTQRRSSQEANQIAQRNAAAAERAAVVAGNSSAIAERAAAQADKAAAQLHSFRLHDDTMKTLYWAADHAIVPETSRALLGLEVLGALVTQAEEDEDNRGRRLVRATSDAVKAVAIPTFLSVLTNAVNDDTEDGSGSLTITSIDLNAAKLLLAHGHDLDTGLRNELEVITRTGIGHTLRIEELYAASHLDSRVELARERQIEQERTATRRMGLSR